MQYVDAARKYLPDRINILFVAESPPAYKTPEKKSYFFFENNPGGEILFATLVKAVFRIEYRKGDKNKVELLERLKAEGYWLMDVVEEPINRVKDKRIDDNDRRPLLKIAIPNFLARICALQKTGHINKQTGIITIKALVYDVVSPILEREGFRVLNEEKIDFPKYYDDRDTILGIRKAISNFATVTKP